MDYALEGGNGRLATFMQDILNVDTASREKPHAITAPLKDLDGQADSGDGHDFEADANVCSIIFVNSKNMICLGNFGKN